MSKPYHGMRPLTDEEIPAMVAYMKEHRQYSGRDIALFTMQCKLGFRIKEMLSLQVKDIFPFPPAVSETVTMQRRNLKGGRRQRTNVHSRTVTIPRSIIQMLEDYGKELTANGYGPEDPLFPSRVGTPLRADSVCRSFRRMARALQATGVCTHSCRKTFAKNIYKATGNDIMETKNALGHSNVATTQQYLAYSLDDKFRQAMLNS